MTPAKEEIQKAKFRGIIEGISQMTYINQCLLRLAVGVLREIDFDLTTFPKEIGDALAKIKPRQRYEANAIKLLANSLFKNVDFPESKKQSLYFRLGHGVCGIINLQRVDKNSPAFSEAASTLASIVTELNILPGFDTEKLKITIGGYIEAAKTFFSESPQLPLAELQEFIGGFNHALKALQTMQAPIGENSDATKISYLLIFICDYGECFQSVEEFEKFMREGTKFNLSGTSESFKKHCQRLGFHGARYSRSMKRRKLGDKAKRGV